MASGSGQVVGLSLKSNNLQGRVPPSLWRLPNLHTLIISFNNVELSFSSSSTVLKELKMHSTNTKSVAGIENFSALTSLHMSGTKLGSVEMPGEILQLANLRALHMAQCELEGTIPDALAQLPLQELNLYQNNLAGTLPMSLQQLTDLEILTLSRNSLHGTLPDFLNNFANLQQLFLEKNQFEGPLPAFDGLTRLYKLYLNENQLSGNIPDTFLNGIVGSTAEEVRVNLQHNRLRRLIPASLDRLENVNLLLLLANNMYTGYEDSSVLCDNVKWMDGLVGEYGCEAIACDRGTINGLGRRTANSACQRCDTADTLGQTLCLDGGDPASVLQQLYIETDGDNWKQSVNWFKPNTGYCDWFGIECYAAGDTSAIKRIELSNNNLVGTVPKTIYSLDGLKSFNFGYNPELVVPFEGMELAEHLFYVNVGHTATSSFDGIDEAHDEFKVLIADHLSVEGTIPSAMFALTALQILSLAECDLGGTVSTEIGNLQSLQEIYLYNNNLRGELPTELGMLSNLRILSMAHNRLSGTLPLQLDDGLLRIQALSLQDQTTKGGGISGNVVPLSNSPDVRMMYMGNNKLEGPIPPYLLGQVPFDRAIIVDFSNNELTGTVPGALARFENMNLMVQDNLIVKVDNSICAKDQWMNGNVGEFGCDAIACPEYTIAAGGRRQFDSQACIDCEDSNAKNVLGQSQCGGKDLVLTERDVLQLLYSNCNGRNWKHQINWNTDANVCDWYGVSCDNEKSIVAIVLGHNNLVGTIPTHIYTLPNLKRLSLFSNEVHMNFEGIENAVQLSQLVLDNTNLRSIEGIGMARGLTELNLGDNRLTGPIPTELSRLVSLEALILRNNFLTGTLPIWVGNLHELTTFLLDDNQISGGLLSFDNYQHLTMLNLSTNVLTGPIPRTFLLNSPRSQKVYVDVSNNRLSGTIPFDLERSEKLSLRAHMNQIKGLNPRLCTLPGWNDGDVQKYGCDGILCPAGTWNDKGRQSSDDKPCVDCDNEPSQFLGATRCGPASSAERIMPITAAMTLGVAVSLLLWGPCH